MARASVAQTNFNKGVLSPLLISRTDLQAFQSALKSGTNVLPLPQGAFMKRPGTKWIKPVKDSTKLGRLVPFEYSTTQAYMLDFGNLTCRITKDYSPLTTTAQSISNITKANPAVLTYVGADTFANGDRVWIEDVSGMVEVNNREFTVASVNTAANTFQLSGENSSSYTAFSAGVATVGKIIEITTPYADTDLADLSYVQSADTLYLFHPSYAPRKITRSSDTSWTITTMTFDDGPFASLNTDDSIRVRIDGTSYRPGKTVTIYANSSIFASTDVGGLFYLEEIYFDQISVYPWLVAPGSGISAPSVGDQVSYNGNVYSCVAQSGTGWGGYIAPEHTQGDAWDSNSGASNRAKWRYLHSRYCVLQISAYTSATQVDATVITYAPDGLDQPSKSITNCTSGTGGVIRVTSSAHGYADGDYVNIASVTGTTEANGNWRVTYVNANNFELDGSTFVNAYVSGGAAIRYSTWLWAHGAFSPTRGYPSCGTFYQDRLVLAATTAQPDTVFCSVVGDYESHAAKSHGVVRDDSAMTVTVSSQKVNKIRWITSDGGGLLVGTVGNEFLLRPATTTKAFGPSNVEAKPNSTHGSKDVAPVSVGSATLFVQRAGKKLREAIYDSSVDRYVANDLTLAANTITKDGIVEISFVQEPDNVVWCARSDGALLGLTYDREQQIVGWHYHALGGSSDANGTIPVVESVASIPSPDGTHDDLYLLVKRYVNGATVRYVEYLDRSWDIHSGATEDAYFVDGGATYDGTATLFITGLNHLRGETLQVRGDGVNLGSYTVSSAGKITLSSLVSVAQVGYAYNEDAERLPIDAGAVDGTSQGKIKRISDMRLRVYRSDPFQIAQDSASLETQTPSSGLYSGLWPENGKKIAWPGGFDPETPVFIRQPNPGPLVVLAMMPVLETAP